MKPSSALHASLRFVLVGTALYLSWYFIYELYLKPSTNFDEWLIHSLVRSAEEAFRFFGVSLTDYSALDVSYKSHIGLSGSLGVTVGAPCDGAPLLALFLSFVGAFPGPWRHKWWYMLVGVITIHLFNVLRIMGLALIVSWNPDWLAFNHDYTFTIAIYGYVFGLWWIWINRFATKTPVQ